MAGVSAGSRIPSATTGRSESRSFPGRPPTDGPTAATSDHGRTESTPTRLGPESHPLERPLTSRATSRRHNARRYPTNEEEPNVFRVGGVSYLRIPAPDPHRTGVFYETVFGWNLRGDPELPSFDDATGH